MNYALLLSVAALVIPSAAAAGEAATADAADGREILVTGKTVGYKAVETTSAMKTDTPLVDVPQSVTVVTRARIDDQALHSIGDVLRYVPGATVGQGEGNRDQITLRGQNTTADFFIDGVRDDVQYYRSLYNIEQVEVLKGPSALIFGRGGGGGVVNRVQKTPLAGQFAATAGASANSFGAWDIAADLNAPLAENASFRLNAFHEDLANHRDRFGGSRHAVNPYLAASFGPWQLGLSYEYVHDDRVVDRGVPSVATAPGQPNRPLAGQRDTFFGVPDVNRTGLDAHIARARIDTALAPNLKWSTTVLYGHYDKFYTNAYASAAATSDTGTAPLGAYHEAVQRENVIAQTNLVWDINVGGVGNKVLAGLEYANQHSANQRRNGTLSDPTFAFTNPVYPTVSFGPPARDTVSTVKVFSAYAQDQVSFGPHVDLVLGLRYDRFQIDGIDRISTPARPFARTDEKISPRLGLILKPQESMSVYASYSQSFVPRSGDQFLSLTAVQANLEPERFTNYELGAKWDIRPDLAATVAVFQLDRTNATTPDPANPLNTINIGETRTRGLELALTGRLLPSLQTSAAYTYQDGKLKGNDNVRLGQLPRHQLAFWNRYNLTPSFGLGLGVIHQSSQFAAIRTTPETTRLPGFTRVDAAVFWKPLDRLDLQVNLENLFDATYFADAHNNNNISPGAPISARFTARVRF